MSLDLPNFFPPKKAKVSIKTLTKTIIKSFSEDCKFLFCEEPSEQPKATDHIDLMIQMISELIDKGFEKMQASEKDKASRTASNAARSKKMRGKVSLAPEMSKGGMPKKSFAKPGSYSSAYNKGGMAKKK